MTLAADFQSLRDAINDCVGYRILDDDDVLLATDETVCGSLLYSDYGYEWTALSDDDFAFMVGRTVSDMNDPKHNSEMDVSERMFRRRVP